MRATSAWMVFVIGCGGGAAAPMPDAPKPRSDAIVAPSGQPLVSGDTISARTERVELAGDAEHAVAVWVDTSPAIAARAVVIGLDAKVVGAPIAFAPQGVTEARALVLADGTQLAAGIATGDHQYLVATIGDDGTAGAPVALATPSQDCRFAVPAHLACTLADGTTVVGTIAPGIATIAFGPPRDLGALGFGARATKDALLFADPTGCTKLAKLDAATGEIGEPSRVECPLGGTPATLTTALAPRGTADSDLVFARVFTSTRRDCAIDSFTPNLVKSTDTTGKNAACPTAVAWDAIGDQASISIAANGTASVTSVIGAQGPGAPASPVLGIGNLKGADILGIGLVAITDGERIQFAFQTGVPI